MENNWMENCLVFNLRLDMIKYISNKEIKYIWFTQYSVSINSC